VRRIKKTPESFGRACTGEIVHAGEYVCRADWRIHDVRHPFDGLFYVACGKVRVWMDGREHEGRAGDLFFMLRGQKIRAVREGKGRVSTLSTGFRVDVAGGMSLLTWRADRDKVTLVGQERKRFVGLFWKLIDATTGGSEVTDLEAFSRLLFLLHEALEYTGLSRLEGNQEVMEKAAGDRVSLVLGMIEGALAGEVTLNEMARWANLSRGHFSKWFLLRMGVSPMRYVRMRRVERAKAMLAQGTPTVEEVARRVGYEDAAHFARVFRGETGQAPRAYALGLHGGDRK
jgi:AraC family transcriptional regulator